MHLRSIIDESGAILDDTHDHFDPVVNTFHSNGTYNGIALMANIAMIRKELSEELEQLMIVNGMIVYLDTVHSEFIREKAAWSYHNKKVSNKPLEELPIAEEPGDRDRSRGKKRATISHKQKKINKKVKSLSRQVHNDGDDDESSLSSSESKEKNPREEASKLSATLHAYGENASYLNQKVPPEAKSIVELDKKTRHYHGSRETDDKTPYISSLALDDARWVPVYVVQGLTKEKKKENLKSYQSDQGTATLIQQVATFWASHMITGACIPEAVITRIMMAIQNIHQLGISEARTYEKQLISYFTLQLQQGDPPDDINEALSSHVDAVDKEVERDTKYQNRQKGKGKGAGQYLKNKGVIPKWNGDWSGANKNQQKYQEQTWGQGNRSWGQGYYHQNGKAQDYQPKSGGKGESKKDNPQSHICFSQDARKGTTCKRQGCKNQHLDTTIAAEAKRFDDAKNIADANWNKKHGNF